MILDAELGLSADVLQNMRQMIATAPATFEHRVQTNVLPDLDLVLLMPLALAARARRSRLPD